MQPSEGDPNNDKKLAERDGDQLVTNKELPEMVISPAQYSKVAAIPAAEPKPGSPAWKAHSAPG
jgi:hypothetical protein